MDVPKIKKEAVKMKQETKDALLAFIGDRTDDEAISILETINDDGEDWYQKYIDNDNEWRKRYTARFKEGGTPQPTTTPEQETDPEEEMKKLTIESVLYDDNK